MSIRYVLLASALAGCTSAAIHTNEPAYSSSEPPVRETVEFHFAPRPGTAQFNVNGAHTLLVDGQKVRGHWSRMQATSRVLEVPEGFVFLNEQVSLQGDPPDPFGRDLLVQMAERVQALVSRKGEFLTVRNLEGLQSGMLSWFDSAGTIRAISATSS